MSALGLLDGELTDEIPGEVIAANPIAAQTRTSVSSGKPRRISALLIPVAR